MVSIMVQGGIAIINADRTKFYDSEKSKTIKNMALSRGKNIVLLYFDAFATHMLDEVLQNNPEIWEGLDGFTWYKNTVSAGQDTLFGSPGIFGGEEYTPDKIVANIVSETLEITKEKISKATEDVENKFVNTIKQYGARVMLYGESGQYLLNSFEENNKNNYRDILDPNEHRLFLHRFYYKFHFLDLYPLVLARDFMKMENGK